MHRVTEAGNDLRIFAHLLDSVIMAFCIAVVMYFVDPLASGQPRFHVCDPFEEVLWGFLLIGIVLFTGQYYLFLLGLFSPAKYMFLTVTLLCVFGSLCISSIEFLLFGNTLGKMLLGIKVQRANGAHLLWKTWAH